MRTTVTLDDDVQVMIKKAMRERDASFNQILNDGLRAGLVDRVRPLHESFQQLRFSMGKPLIDLTKASALGDELEDQAAANRIANGR